jgi:PTS system fructose-specific IIA component
MTIEATTIDRLMPPELVTLAEPPSAAASCLAFLVDVAVEAGRIDDRDRVVDAVHRRAGVEPAGVGAGVAVVHATTTGVSQPSLIVGRSAAGVDFDAVVSDPSYLLFVLLSPAGNDDGVDHREVLNALSRALVDERVRESIRTATSTTGVRGTLTEAMAA